MSAEQATKQPRKGNPNWIKGGPSPNPDGGRRRRGVGGVFRSDGWKSLLTGLGTTMRDKRESFYFEPDLIDWDTALNIYRGDPLGARIVETKPNELVREGYELCITDEADEDEEDASDPVVPGAPHYAPLVGAAMDRLDARAPDAKRGKELAEEVENKWEELELLPAIHEALCYENAYGGAAILIGANDGSTDLSMPLLAKNVKSVDFLTVLEPREIMPVEWYGDPRAPKYGRPAIYQLTPSVPGITVDKKIYAGVQRIHESRLIIFPGIRVTRRNISALGGWGDSVFTRVYRVLRDFNMSWGAAGVLVADFAQAVYKMKGLNEIVQEDPKDTFKQRMIAMEMARSVARATLIDAEDEFKREQTPVSGLPDLLDRFATALAAAADLPLPLLMGESPGGLNASGASGDQLRMFYDRIASLATRRVVPVIRRITGLIFQASGGEPAVWKIEPRALWQPTEKEQAETKKVTADTDCMYIDRGVVSSDEVRESRFGGDGYSTEIVLKQEPASRISPEAMAAYVAEQQVAQQTPPQPKPGALGGDAPTDPGKPALPTPKLGAPTPGAMVPTTTREIQKEAMNGAQISGMLEVIKAAGAKEISRESAAAVLRLGFQVSPEDAEQLLGPANFAPVKPEPPPSPFGGPPKPAFGGGPPKPDAPEKPSAPAAE